MNISFNFYPEGKKKALTMSYDDGQIHDRRLVEIFNKYGIKGTFHLNSGKFGLKPYINSEEVKKLYEGHEISAHSLNHPHLTQVPYEVLVEEIMEDRKNLESLSGYPVRGMSFPFGDYNEDLLNALPYLGIEYSRTVQAHRTFKLPKNFLTWHPTCHHNESLFERLKDFKNTLPWEHMQLFYVWGHSYEFDRDDNWELIEGFCKEISKEESVWYATNVEIMDYIKALKNLKFSVDKRIVFNPSCRPVWISVDEHPLKLDSGERILL